MAKVSKTPEGQVKIKLHPIEQAEFVGAVTMIMDCLEYVPDAPYYFLPSPSHFDGGIHLYKDIFQQLYQSRPALMSQTTRREKQTTVTTYQAKTLVTLFSWIFDEIPAARTRYPLAVSLLLTLGSL